MTVKKPFRKVVVRGRRDVNSVDKKPFRKPVSQVPLAMGAVAQLEFIGMEAGPESELKVLEPKPARRSKKKTPPPIVKPAPWADAGKERDILRSYKMSRETFAKINWIKDNVVRMNSLQKILDSIVLDGIEQLLKEHYR